MELILGGDIIGAEEAPKIGPVSRIVPHDQLIKTAKELAAKIAGSPSIAVELTKRGLQRSLKNDPSGFCVGPYYMLW